MLRIGLFGFTCLLLLLTVTACGFRPLYGTASQPPGHGEIVPHLNQVWIDNIPNYEGQYLRNTLIDRFYLHGRPASPAYVLSIAPIVETVIDLDITKSSNATRAQLRLHTVVKLIDKASGDVLLERQMHATTSYNILQSQFTTRVSETNARRNALDELARQIETALALYFERR